MKNYQNEDGRVSIPKVLEAFYFSAKKTLGDIDKLILN